MEILGPGAIPIFPGAEAVGFTPASTSHRPWTACDAIAIDVAGGNNRIAVRAPIS